MMTDPIELPATERYTRVINHAFGGRHHVRIKEENDLRIRIVYSSYDLSTHDFDRLTALVVAAHTYGVRAEIRPCNMQHIEIYLHARATRDGSQWQRHPTSQDLADRATKHWQSVVESLEATPKEST